MVNYNHCENRVIWSYLRIIVKYALLTNDYFGAVFSKYEFHTISNELPVVIKNTCSFSKLIFSLRSSQWQKLRTLNGERILNDCWAHNEHTVSEHWTLCEQYEHERSKEHKTVSYTCRVITWWTFGDCTVNSERTGRKRWTVNARWGNSEQWTHGEETVDSEHMLIVWWIVNAWLGNGKQTQKWEISCRIWKSRRHIVSKSTMVKCIAEITNQQQAFQRSAMKAMSN